MSSRRSHREQATPKSVGPQDARADTAGPVASQSPPTRRQTCFAALLILIIGGAAIANNIYGDFVLDDIFEIEQNPEMSFLLPPWRAAFAGRVIPARPIPYYTFAIDTALWHRRPHGYHFFNNAIHLGSALFVFGIARRTLREKKLVERFGSHATTLAFFIAVLWVVHPIQTQAVTYIYQRLESLMSFFFLAAFYAFIRSRDSARPNRWLIASFAFTLSAVMSKESSCAIPPLLFLYDVVFWTDSWRETLRSRARFYIALLLTYIPLAVLVLSLGSAYEEFRSPRSAIGYALSQPIIILRYLQLCFYPTEQCLDYLWQRETEPHRIVGPLILVGGLFVAGVVGILRRRAWGWLIAAFFLPLLPTSSFIPVNDLANEHRMYLALGAVATAVVLAGFAAHRRLVESAARPKFVAAALMVVAAAAIVALGCVTHERNKVYHNLVGMWEDVTSKAPHNKRALQNLASAYLASKQSVRAIETARRIVDDPTHRHRGLMIIGSAQLDLKDRAGAIESLSQAIAIDPDGLRSVPAYVNLAVAIGNSDPERVAELNRKALEIDPMHVPALINVANARARAGDFDNAEQILRYAEAISPGNSLVAERLRKVLEDQAKSAGN